MSAAGPRVVQADRSFKDYVLIPKQGMEGKFNVKHKLKLNMHIDRSFFPEWRQLLEEMRGPVGCVSGPTAIPLGSGYRPAAVLGR